MKHIALAARTASVQRTAPAARAALGAVLALALVSCAGMHGAQRQQDGAGQRGNAAHPSPTQQVRTPHAGALPAGFRQIPDVGPRLLRRIPAGSRQVLAVYGVGRDSAWSTASLFVRQDGLWHRSGTWVTHNGRNGWTPHHHEGDKRSPVGVFTLSDAGGVLPDPGAKLPYTASALFQAPHYWPRSHWHDFDYVIAIDYNRVKGTTPLDPTRPQGQAKGGSIWLHMDHGSGTSGCVSLSKPGMEYLLRTLDPRLHPVVVMGDRAGLAA